MNQLHKIDNINNDFLQRCFFFLNCKSTNVIDEKKPWKRCYYQFLWFFWMSVTTFMINETSLFFGLRSSYDYRDKF